jgi:uncharacterized tellurite resistance protein B-like protein|tara:strand:- start:495 stop:914 length:420 start_codon:yes stop_codon:yes gene_type:complete
MIGRLFKKRAPIEKAGSERVDVVLRLMFEIAMSDGTLDKSEIAILKKRAEHVSTEEEKASDVIKRVIDEAAESSSLYPTVQEINKEFCFDQKAEVLKNLWELIAIDGIINHYEENLYFKIAELIRVKRSKANQIKQETS